MSHALHMTQPFTFLPSLNLIISGVRYYTNTWNRPAWGKQPVTNNFSYMKIRTYFHLLCNYSETCLTWPPTVPEKVVNISKWSTYTNVSQSNFHTHILFPANYLLIHIETAQHINGDRYGQKKILIYLHNHWSTWTTFFCFILEW